jgi:cysteine desulfurase
MSLKRPVYFDYQSTTPCDPEVIEHMLPYFKTDQFGNPSARKNKQGLKAKAVIDEVKEELALLLGGSQEGFILTNGATEANNMALLGLPDATPEKNEIIISALEHQSITNCIPALKRKGYIVHTLPVDTDGIINLDEAKKHLSTKTKTVCVMIANHEIGTIQPVKQIASLAHDHGSLIHCDAAQAVGKVAIDIEDWGIDSLSLSAHKFYGPQGIGALYMSPRLLTEFAPVMYGGNQQINRSGTIPLPLATGLGKACSIARVNLQTECARLQSLTALALQKLKQGAVNYRVNGSMEHRLPGSLSLLLPNISAEDLLLDLIEDISASTGSACGSGNKSASPVLKAIGLSDDDAACCIRLSLGRFTTEDDINHLVSTLSSYLLSQDAA